MLCAARCRCGLGPLACRPLAMTRVSSVHLSLVTAIHGHSIEGPPSAGSEGRTRSLMPFKPLRQVRPLVGTDLAPFRTAHLKRWHLDFGIAAYSSAWLCFVNQEPANLSVKVTVDNGDLLAEVEYSEWGFNEPRFYPGFPGVVFLEAREERKIARHLPQRHDTLIRQSTFCFFRHGRICFLRDGERATSPVNE
ncbi:hypothetical protein B0T10DRAFT_460397 [Thelonectria olida]|uniref:Uncharacterized protein n=1 Tax=Thelonectria olida TaxID=1576542 RepID=A0A9P9AS26_9HYPO|nr:hypothetical protein B0T10DRAFT_460397 [Thelonectria olida]